MASKWTLHRLYSRHSRLRRHLPRTAILSESALHSYLSRYGSVYIKGKNEHMGHGIIKAWKTGGGYRYIRVKGGSSYAGSIRELLRRVRAGRALRSVLVQQAIPLACVRGRPFDIRVMIMRDGRKQWRYAGMLAKIAGRSSVVTNVRRGGGYVLPVEEALARSLRYSRGRVTGIKRQLTAISREAVRFAVKNGHPSHESGVDMAIDRRGKIWIIEVNLVYPSHALFRRLSDQRAYRKIKALAAAYRRRKRSSV